MLHSILEKYQAVREFVFNEDPENEERVGTVYFPLTIILAYLIFIKWIGPLIMKPFKPLRLNAVLIAFNIFIVTLNAYVSFSIAYVFYDCLKKGMFCNFNKNEAIKKEYMPKVFKFVWSYYISKYVDLFDTIFFVLRKKERQVSHLHVFHHTVVILIAWTGIRTKNRNGFIALVIILNSFVHVCTYSYYALTAFGPKFQRFLYPRKIYLTFFQVAQFWILLGYILWGFFSGCETFDMFMITCSSFLLLLMLFFANFYIKNYKKKQ